MTTPLSITRNRGLLVSNETISKENFNRHCNYKLMDLAAHCLCCRLNPDPLKYRSSTLLIEMLYHKGLTMQFYMYHSCSFLLTKYISLHSMMIVFDFVFQFSLVFCWGSRQTGYLLSPLETRHQVSRQIGAVVV